MEIDRSKILDKIEEIQDSVDAKGFIGSNENDLWRREEIADYIINNFVIHIVSQQRELLMLEIEKYHYWYTGDKDGAEYAKDYLNSINCG